MHQASSFPDRTANVCLGSIQLTCHVGSILGRHETNLVSEIYHVVYDKNTPYFQNALGKTRYINTSYENRKHLRFFYIQTVVLDMTLFVTKAIP